jgi:transposase
VEERGHDILVVEDGAPRHVSKLTLAARAELGIKNLTHPPKSPNLNPIEPLWNLLKNRIADIPGSINSLDKLWEAAQKVWSEITADEIKKHTRMMNDRVQAVKEANGWHTKY